MNISPEEAALALREIEASRQAMRRAIRDYRGHIYLWIWGAVWVAISILEALHAPNLVSLTNWISIAGMAATAAAIFIRRQPVRKAFDKRFIAVCGTLLVFGYLIWPIFLGGPRSFPSGYGYSLLLWMQLYIVAGIWFDNYWLWIGLAMTVLIVAAFLLFPAYFWIGPLLGGATLVATGFHVRNGCS
jgi:hypothetical protein